MHSLQFSIQNITDGQGVELAIAGMLIVFTVLILISMFIALLPKILRIVAQKYPEQEIHPATTAPSGSTGDEAILAAIGYVLHARIQGKA
jgi:Na+-transporting methylmalonyl-CoA/oxaloacetate decarboxylase gamma subunit|tara:strand:+ start:323 stop:592 length:270 start_codon:yes stop_codon:yes gene_type:complete